MTLLGDLTEKIQVGREKVEEKPMTLAEISAWARNRRSAGVLV